MMVQIKRLIIFVLLGISVLTFSQNESKTNRLFLGFKLSGGSAETDVKSQFSFFDPLEVDNKLLNSWAPSVYLEQRFLESFSFHVGASYMNSNYSFLDISTTNYGYYDAFTTQYKVSNKIKYVETEIGLKKIFLTDQVIRPFLALNFNLSFVDSDSLNLIKSENNTSYQTKLGYVQDKMEGLSPEIGVMLSTSGGGNWIFSVKKHCAFDQLMGGEFASFNQNFTHANYSEIITSGNYFHFSVGYQLPLKTWNLKDKSEKKQEKELKKREAEEQKQREADEKERIAEEKRKAKLEKEEAKKKQLDEKEVENEDKLKTDASGKPKELKGRSIKIQEEFEVNSLVIELSLWDDGAEIDGDSVDVFFNGEWIKKNVGLTKSRQIITLNIDPKQKNYLIIYAINEGEHSPNTAAISFNNGTREKKFRIHSKINENGAVRFKYKE